MTDHIGNPSKVYCGNCSCVQDCIVKRDVDGWTWYCTMCKAMVDEDWDNETDEYNETGV